MKRGDVLQSICIVGVKKVISPITDPSEITFSDIDYPVILRQRPLPLLPIPDLTFVAATTVVGFCQLAGLLCAQQLDVFAFAQVQSEAVEANRDIRF